MTCRFELEYNGEQYPRSCPTCQLGPCKQGYKQVKFENGGYALLNSSGIAPKRISDKWKETGIPSEVLIEQGKVDDKPVQPPPGATTPTIDTQLTPAEIADIVWDRNRRRNPYTKPHLTRTQRAKCIDLLDDFTNNEHAEMLLNKLLDEIIAIIYED